MLNAVYKLFKALNSSAKAWQLSLAAVLAMFVGFLPSTSLILLDLLLIALLLNVNFGLFLLLSLFFGGLGYLFDPLFESIGYSVLTSEVLNGVFTSMYNSVLFRWSEFNYTLVTGSLVVSSVLALPLYFGLNVLITTYRVQFAEKLNSWKLTSWMHLFNEEVKSVSVFRWWALSVYAAVLAVIFIFMLLILDPLLRVSLEKGLSYTLKTEVTIDELDSDLSDLEVKIIGVQVADNEKLTHNIVQIKRIEFDLGFDALLEKKLEIQQLGIDAVAFDQLRTTPASLYSATSVNHDAETKAKTSETSSMNEAFSFPDVDDILNKEALSSIAESKALRNEISQMKLKWEKESERLQSSTEVDEITADAKALQAKLKGAGLQDILSAKKDIDALKNKIKTLKKRYSDLQTSFDTDKRKVASALDSLKGLSSQDISRLKQKYSPMGSGGQGIVANLFNEQISSTIQTGLKYYELLKPYLNEKQAVAEEKVSPPRGMGRWIVFENRSAIPEFFVKEATVNMLIEDEPVEVRVNDFSSDQTLSSKPMRLKVDANTKTHGNIMANLTDDRRTVPSIQSFDINMVGFQKSGLELESLKMKDILADVKFDGSIQDEILSSKGVVKVKEAGLSMPSQKQLDTLLANINSFRADVRLEGKLDAPDIAITTDIDKQLSKALSDTFSKEAKKFEKALTDGVMKRVNEQTDGMDTSLGGIDKLLDGKQSSLNGINLDFKASSNPLKGILSF